MLIVTISYNILVLSHVILSSILISELYTFLLWAYNVLGTNLI